MHKKIFNIQFLLLMIIAMVNLVYFYYQDLMPDSYFEISNRNLSINFLSYYLTTFLVNIGYWSGLWSVSAFLIFAIIKFLFRPNGTGIKANFITLPLILLNIFIYYLFMPGALGEGLFSLLYINLSLPFILSSIVLLKVCLIFLIDQKVLINLVNKFTVFFNETIVFLRSTKFFNITLSKVTSKFSSFKTDKLTSVPVIPTVNKIILPKLERKIQPIEAEDLGAKPISSDDFEDFSSEETDDLLEEASESNDDLNYDEEIDESVSNDFTSDQFFDSEDLINCIAPKDHGKKITDPDEQYFVSIARAIENKLQQFNITAQIINVLKGPVVDTFELELGAGVKVTGVTNRTDDLSLALMGAPIRMVYPMKGKSTIGIEVPRNPRDVIYLDEVLKSKEFNNSNYKLPVAMGKDAYGDAAVIDLASTPHLLVAGTTGAGKSVFINTLLVSLIIKFSPKKLRLIMLDPKQLELALYQKLPHLVMPVVTDPQIASVALLWAIDEMERRYSLLKDFGVKNIEGFNKKIKTVSGELLARIPKYYPEADFEGFELPFIVVVVDEFADLMLSKSGKAIETSISRLAAKARASGIHIVLATQRPSTDIITGVIKANFPTRVSFRVFTNIDSRVILDGVGAEKLLGKGDMLFKQGIDILRMHSAYVNEEEIEALVNKLSTLPTQYDTGAMDFIETNGAAAENIEGGSEFEAGEGQRDDKYNEAIRCVAMHRVASASFLQRRLGVGYNRAANLIEEMERHGVVGPAQGSKPRKVLIPPPNDSTP
jgi:S-DNA-T family DNA segregation ATPase FtsK/SpoIIIE